MPLYRDRGVVLRTHKLGEADRIISILTEEHGRVRGVAKGVRKTNSRFGGRLEPLSHVEVQLYEGRTLDTITQVETIEAHRTLREDVDRFVRACTMVEAMEALTPEREPDADAYRILVGGLRTLGSSDAPFVLGAFLIRLLDHAGVAPMLDACVVCGATEDLRAIDLSLGGVVCPLHRTAAEALDPDCRAAMQGVLAGEVNRTLATFDASVGRRIEHLAVRALESHLERRLKSPRLLGDRL